MADKTAPAGATARARWPEPRARKFRQAAFVYLHLGILYEAAAWVMYRHDMLPARFGPPVLFLLLGAGIVLFVFWGLFGWENVWIARIIWGVQALRFPPLINRAFVDTELSRLPPGFYIIAMVIVLVSMWALARAAWDL
ncbi:MAG TPA: hypothetical protein VGA37_15655 [Gemmatimonadales bacterium]